MSSHRHSGRCEMVSRAASNNGMHPTADTTNFICLQRPDAPSACSHIIVNGRGVMPGVRLSAGLPRTADGKRAGTGIASYEEKICTQYLGRRGYAPIIFES